VGKINVNPKTVIKWFPNARHLLPLGDGIGRHKSGSDACPLHKLCRLEIPAGNIVNFPCCLVRFALFIDID